MFYEKALRGLSIDEMQKLINIIVAEGQRSQPLLTDYGKITNDVVWLHSIMGIALQFTYHKGNVNVPSFRLEGSEWAITFKGSRSSSLMPRFHDYIEIRIGPLERTMRPPPTATKFFAHQFRRRGKLSDFKHDLTLLRLTL
jgi:hypothetical protein